MLEESKYVPDEGTAAKLSRLKTIIFAHPIGTKTDERGKTATTVEFLAGGRVACTMCFNSEMEPRAVVWEKP